jgi:hypothetical protein
MADFTVRNPLGIAGTEIDRGPVTIDMTVEVAAGALSGTVYYTFPLPMRARIHGLSVLNIDDLASTGAPTLDIGLYTVDSTFTSDADAINDGIDAATAANGIRVVKDIANYGKRLWELLGLAADPGGYAKIGVSIQDAAANTGGTMTMTLHYSAF